MNLQGGPSKGLKQLILKPYYEKKRNMIAYLNYHNLP